MTLLTSVRRTLRSYAARGIFRSFDEIAAGGGRVEFRFGWLLGATFRLVCDPRRGVLFLPDLLPGIPAKSPLYAELKAFVKERLGPRVAAHRRLDPRRVAVRCAPTNGTVSIRFRVLDGHSEYATRKAVNLVHEIFVSFLELHHRDYLVEAFRAPEE